MNNSALKWQVSEMYENTDMSGIFAQSKRAEQRWPGAFAKEETPEVDQVVTIYLYVHI